MHITYYFNHKICQSIFILVLSLLLNLNFLSVLYSQNAVDFDISNNNVRSTSANINNVAFGGTAATSDPGIYTLCFVGEASRLCIFDPATPGQPVKVITPPGYYFDVSRSGNKMAWRDWNFTLYIGNIDGSEAKAVGTIPSDASFSLAPNATRIAYRGNDGLKVLVADTGELITLESQNMSNTGGFLVWSPDGTSLLYNRDSQNPATYRIPANGSGPPVQLTTPPDNSWRDSSADWFPDGSAIVVYRYQPASRGREIIFVSAEGGLPTRIMDISEYGYLSVRGIKLNPNASQIAIVHSEGDHVLRLSRIPSGGGVPVLLHASSPATTNMPYVGAILAWGGPGDEPELIVNSISDRPNQGIEKNCDTGETVEIDGENVPECTLRAAMEVAAERGIRDSISVNIPTAGPYIINLSSPLPALSSPLVIDATTQPGFSGLPLVTINGGGISNGFVLDQGESTVRGLAIGGFTEAGIYITGPGGNIIENSYLGLDASGTSALGNGIGILIDNSADNVIGGIADEHSTYSVGNIISGNAKQGVLIQGNQSEKNSIAGNFIGTDYTGNNSVGNESEGIKIDGAPRNLIGGGHPNDGNVLSGNLAHGIYITGTASSDNRIEGNVIGLSAIANSPMGNGTDTDFESGHTGIFIEYAGNTIIGGATASPGDAPGNIISGNASHGIRIKGDISGENAGSADHTFITGNLIGLDASGTVPMPNGGIGILLQGGVREARVGESDGTNIIVTENFQAGIVLVDAGEDAGAPDRTQIQSNILGMTAMAGTAAGAMGPGILVAASGDRTRGVKEVKIGGEGDHGNRISALIGIYIEGERSANTGITGNSIGLLGDGKLAREEIDAVGILITLADSVQIVDNTVGGQVMGIVLASNDNEVYGNFLGTDPAGTSARANDMGLYIPGEIVSGDRIQVGSGNQIGQIEKGNTISGNKQIGIIVGGRFSPPGSSGMKAAESHSSVISDVKMLSTLTASLQSQITNHEIAKPALQGSERTKKAVSAIANDEQSQLNGIVIAYNRIGTNSAGTSELGNGRSESPDDAYPGIFLQDGTGTILFGNTISGNGAGVAIAVATDFPGRPEGTLLAGNRIGASATSMETIPNQYGGILIDQSSHNAIITAPLNEGEDPVANIILGNGGAGIRIINFEGYGNSNTIRHTSFLENDGPAIDFFNGNSPGSYPAGIPQPPIMILGTVNDSVSSAEFHLRTTTPGSLDLFTSTRCLAFSDDDNEETLSKPTGDGLYFLSAETEAGVTGVVSVPLNTLPANPVGLYISSTLTSAGENASTSSFSECRRVALQEDVVVVETEGDQEEVVLEGPGIDVDVTLTIDDDSGSQGLKQISETSMSSGGRLYAMRYHLSPDNNIFEGEATAPDGSSIRPDAVSNTRYWTLAADGLTVKTYSACLDIADLAQANDSGHLVLVHRENSGRPWKPYSSTLHSEGTKLCASGLTAFGDLGIGGAGVFVSNENDSPYPDEIPTLSALHQNYPNPFNPTTMINFDIPVAGHVRVVIYDLTGRSVQTLVDGQLSAGSHQVTFDAGRLSSGVYLYRLETAGFTATRKMMLMK
ncbi:hypothetical protein BH23BAC3_BH23BAC3_28250 [soil metagenome]